MKIEYDYDKVNRFLVTLKDGIKISVYADEYKHDDEFGFLCFYIDGMSISYIDDCYWEDVKELK